MIFTRGPVLYLAREIALSTDPAKHARDVVANAIKHRFAGVALQIDDVNTVAGVPKLLRDACVERGYLDGYGTWAQGLDPDRELVLVRAYGGQHHGLNAETPEETVKYLSRLDQFVALGLPGGLSCIFTQGAFEAGTAGKQQEFIRRGLFGVPESDPLTGDPLAVSVMAANLGWPWSQLGPMAHLDRADAAWYGPALRGETGAGALPNWSVWTYGNVETDAEWAQIDTWPNGYTPPPPPPPPADKYAELEKRIAAIKAANPKIAAVDEEVLRHLRRIDP